jgi:hypothetical protein
VNARHEAAHAIAARVLGIEVIGVCLAPDRSYLRTRYRIGVTAAERIDVLKRLAIIDLVGVVIERDPLAVASAADRENARAKEPTSSSGLVNDIKDRREFTLRLRSSSGPSVRSSRSVSGLPLIYGVMDRLGHDPAILDQKRVSAVAHAGMLGLRRPLQKGDAPLYETVRIDVRCSGQFLLQ